MKIGIGYIKYNSSERHLLFAPYENFAVYCTHTRGKKKRVPVIEVSEGDTSVFRYNFIGNSLLLKAIR